MKPTFKSFLSETELSDLALELFLRKEVGVSKEGARGLRLWYQDGSKDNRPMAGDTWHHLVDWAVERHRQETGKDLYDLAKGAVSMPLLVKGVLAKHFHARTRRTDESEELSELAFMLALRKKYRMTKEQAREVIAWFKNEKDWGDLEHDVRDVFIDIWDPHTPDLHHPGMHYSDFVMDEIHMAMKKYQIDTRDFG